MNQQQTILIVDDDPEIRRLLSSYLSQHGFATKTAANGDNLISVIESEPTDLVVLDNMMPGKDGFTLCREVRAYSDVPIIMLTSRGDLIDRIVGLELGADDYIPKPFDPRELLTRIRAVLRRAQTMPKGPRPSDVRLIRFAQWELDTVTRQLLSPDGVVVALSGAEYDLLRAFVDRPNRVLNRDQLMNIMEGKSVDPFDRTIDVRVSRLRQRLLDDARSPRIIKTIRSEGYILAVEVVRVP
jgi:two-component system OmpR family response regulator